MLAGKNVCLMAASINMVAHAVQLVKRYNAYKVFLCKMHLRLMSFRLCLACVQGAVGGNRPSTSNGCDFMPHISIPTLQMVLYHFFICAQIIP